MSKSWFKMMAKGTTATVFIDDYIGYYGVEAKTFVRDLNALDVNLINVEINSPGGSVFDGLRIYNALKSHDAKVITGIVGWAASISSIIALSGDEVTAAKNSFYMYHNPFTFGGGDARALRKAAEDVQKIEDEMASIYAEKSGISIGEIHQMMDDETFLTAEEAQEIGFIDRIFDASSAKPKLDEEIYDRAPEMLQAQAIKIPNIRKYERVLRDAGMPVAQSKLVLSRALLDPDALRDAVQGRESDDVHLRDAEAAVAQKVINEINALSGAMKETK